MKTAARKAGDWVVMGPPPFMAHCERCGGVIEQPTLPAPISMVAAWMKAGAALHRNCRVPAVPPPLPGLHPDRQNWPTSNDTGISSTCIWRTMRGATGDGYDQYDYPHDPDDFGRCYRLLELFPEWRERIGQMSSRGRVWAALAAHWGELEALWREEGDGTGNPPRGTMMPRLYERMRELIDKSRAPSGEPLLGEQGKP